MDMKSASTSRLRIPRLLGVAAALLAIVAFGLAQPASAAPNTIYTPDGGGSARFANYGDHIYLCDHAEDGHSVMVWVRYYHEDGYWKTLERWNWWGPKKYNGCKDINLRVKEQTWVEYYVCLGDHAKPGGKPPKVITGTCSWLMKAYNNG